MMLPFRLFALFTALAAVVAIDERPIIGILSQATSGSFTVHGKSYVAASYVKWIEMGGARAALLPFDASATELRGLLFQMNGALFPGGGADLSPGSQFRTSAEIIFNYTVEANSQGNPFVLWGTCLGFETLSVIAAASDSVLSGGFDSEHLSLPLSLTPAAASSVLFSSAAADVLQTLTKENVTLNNHMAGVEPVSFANDQGLSSFFNVLSTNEDRKGKPFVSTIEAKEIPVFGTQFLTNFYGKWHPEKDVFEWNTNEALPHSIRAVEAIQWTSSFLGGKAREAVKKDGEGNSVSDKLFFNFNPVYTGKEGSDFEQCYFWE